MSGLKREVFRVASAAALSFGPAGLTAAPALAQTTSDFRLEPGTPSPTPNAQGPIDPERPIAPGAATPGLPTPAPTPSATPTAAPAATASTPPPTSTATARGTPTPRATAAAGTPPRAAPSSPRAAPAAAPIVSAPASVPEVPTAPEPAPAAELAPAAPVQGTPSPAPALAPAPREGIAWWWLIPAALVGAGIAGIALRRRPARAAGAALAPAQDMATDRPQPANDRVAAPPAAAPRTAAAPVPVMPAPLAEDPLDLRLEPERLSITLVNATLHYRLVVSNRSAHALGPVAIAADMVSAHASIPTAALLGHDEAGMELRHELPALAPGESAEVSGSLRLPLTEVTPIRASAAALLVPLVRLRAETGTQAERVHLIRTVVVGESPTVPGGPLRPFRLDIGPRLYGDISQRDVALAAAA